MHSMFSHSSHTHTSLQLFLTGIGAQAQVQPQEQAWCYDKEHLLLKDISSWARSPSQICQLKSMLQRCKDSFGLLQLNASAYRGQKGNTERINEDQALSKSQRACTQWFWCSDFKLVSSIQKSPSEPYFLQNTSAYWNTYINSVMCIFIEHLCRNAQTTCVNRALLLKGWPHTLSAWTHQVPDKASLQMPVQDDGPAGLGGYQLPSFNRGRRSPGATHVSHRAQKDAEAQRSSALLQCLAPVGKGD